MNFTKQTILEEASLIIARSRHRSTLIQDIVDLIKKRSEADACTLFLTDSERKVLYLKASSGLFKKKIDSVSTSINEGLTGATFRLEKKIVIKDVALDSRFCPFIDENNLSSFVGIPLLNENSSIGVITLQSYVCPNYSDSFLEEINELSNKLVDLILTEGHQSQEDDLNYDPRSISTQIEKSKVLKGYVGSSGLSIGKAVFLDEGISFDFIKDSKGIGIDQEKERFLQAVKKSIVELSDIKFKLDDGEKENGEAIFNTHIMILEDQSFLQKVLKQLAYGYSAEWSLKVVITQYTNSFKKISDSYLRERVNDIYDIGHRILRNIIGVHSIAEHFETNEDCILVSDDLTPSQLILLHLGKVKGFAISEGGVASHFSILAKSFNIPTLVGLGEGIHSIKEGDLILLNANNGTLKFSPSLEEEEKFKHKIQLDLDFRSSLETLKGVETKTKDKKKIHLKSNAGLLQDIEQAKCNGAAGIGLFRTEFQFIGRTNFPSEEEQFSLYSNVLKEMKGLPTSIRTLDIGGDKVLSYLDSPKEKNPFLGWRSIRVSLDLPHIFKTQLRALLRASIYGDLRIIYPLISGVGELRDANKLLEEVKEDLRRENISFNPNIPVGIMIEVPSAVRMASRLIKECDFFSIGTNDLTQYTLAVDRDNQKVAKLFTSFHPAVLDQIRDVCRVAKKARKPVAICGELANEYLFVIPLIGFGVNEFSLTSNGIPFIKNLVSNVKTSQAKKVAKQVLKLDTSEEVKAYLVEYLKSLNLIPEYLIH